jgi:hypothetical protein
MVLELELPAQVSSLRFAVLSEVHQCVSQTVKTCWDSIADAELNGLWTHVSYGVGQESCQCTVSNKSGYYFVFLFIAVRVLNRWNA